MNNPFSNKTTISAGDYLQQKKNIVKINFLKNYPYKINSHDNK